MSLESEPLPFVAVNVTTKESCGIFRSPGNYAMFPVNAKAIG